MLDPSQFDAAPTNRQERLRAWLVVAACLATVLSATTFGATPNGQTSLQSGSRVALVIGNGAYPNAPLLNPVRDARAMAMSLSRVGFQVTLRTDVNLEDMLDAMTKFTRESRADDVRLFFYAGHGVQFNGRNYLMPIDARLESERDVPGMAADVQELVEHLQRRGSGVNVLILDACRTYPVPVVFRHGTRGLPSVAKSTGLAEIVAPGGTLIAFSTAPGSVARDGISGNSLYAKYLLANIEVAGLTIEQLFKRVRTGVMTESLQTQTPWENSSLVGDFCFRSGVGGECPGQPSAIAATPDKPMPVR